MFIVRHVTLDDCAAWQRMRGALWPDGSGEHDQEILAFFGGRLREPAAVLIATNTEGKPLGFAELSIRPYAEGCETDRVAFLEGWYVEPMARRRGVGRALIDAAEGWALGRGCTELGSDALLDNADSHAAHRALGFEDIEQIRCFLKRLDRPRSAAPLMPPVATEPVMVRHADLNDAAVLAGLVTELGYPTTPDEMRSRFSAILPLHDHATLLAIVDRVVAGFIGVSVAVSYTANGRRGHIDALSVSGAFRQRGVGRALVEAAERLLAGREAVDIVVTTANHRSGAHAFYERLGYTLSGRRYSKKVE